MQPGKFHRVLLVIAGLIATGIGASILIAPVAFHAGHGTELGTEANLLSEIRAPGGALAVLGVLMIVGAFVSSFTLASTVIAAAVYLAYGLSRLVSIAADGMPADALLGATALEILFGAAFGLVLLRTRARKVA